MQSKISVIVPVYKVESYLRQCVDSILEQTYANLEIILVDDGSPDNCGAICDEYAGRDSRIIVIHKENGGVSSARNAGLDIATGEYLSFIDSDDWIESDMYEILYNNIKNNDADISFGGYYESYINLNVSVSAAKKIELLNNEQALQEILIATRIPCSSWCKLYKKCVLNDIRFPVDILIGEDLILVVNAISNAVKIVIDYAPKYYYRQRKSSVIQEQFNPKLMHHIESNEYVLKIIREKYPNVISVGKKRVFSANLGVLSKIVFCKNFRQIPEYKTILSTLQKNFRFIMKNKYITKNDKIKAVALQVNIILFKWIHIINFKLEKTKGKKMFE